MGTAATNVTAIGFINSANLIQNLSDLMQYVSGENAIIADFSAKNQFGVVKTLSCFIEHDGSDFQISSIIGAEKNDVNISNLEFDLLSQKIKLS